MKILFIRDKNPFFENSASANRFVGLLNGLMKNGAQVTLLITRGYNNWHEYRMAGIPAGMKNLSVHYSCYTFNQNIWLRRFNSIVIGGIIKRLCLRAVNRYLRKDYDYVWLTKNTDILEAYNNYKGEKKFKSFMELNEFPDIHKAAGAIGNNLQQKNAYVESRAFSKAVGEIDCFAIMTKTLLNYYQGLAKSNAKFIHVPMTVDISRFRNLTDTTDYQKPYIAYTGTFNNAKDGVDILIKSFAKIADKYPKIHLYLAGFWHYDVPAQKQIISDFGLNDRITYLGVLNSKQIPEFVCNASLLVLSRPDSHQAQGGFPTKLGEYLATGNPVCVTKVGEIPNYLTDNESAFLAEPGDVDSFADAMDRALSDANKSKLVGLNGAEIAANEFDADYQSNRLYYFLKENYK